MYRKFIYANGSKMALSLSKEAVRGIVVALCVAGSFKYFVDEGERTNIVKYYKVPQIPSKPETVSDSL